MYLIVEVDGDDIGAVPTLVAGAEEAAAKFEETWKGLSHTMDAVWIYRVEGTRLDYLHSGDSDALTVEWLDRQANQWVKHIDPTALAEFRRTIGVSV